MARKPGAQPGNKNGRGNKGNSYGRRRSPLRLAERARKVEKRGHAKLRKGDYAGGMASLAASRKFTAAAKRANGGVKVVEGRMSSGNWTNNKGNPYRRTRAGYGRAI